MTVSTSDGAALVYNPAGLARQTRTRMQLSLDLAERSASFVSDGGFAATPSAAVDRADVLTLPAGALEIGLSGRVTLGVAALPLGRTALRFATPSGTPGDADRAPFASRYAGTRLDVSVRALGVGVGVRALPWLAVGAAVLAEQVSLAAERTLYVGAPAAGTSLAALDPALDMPFSADGDAFAVPAASLGVLCAPLDAPLELGASVLWSADAHLEGGVHLADSRGLMGAPRYQSPRVSAEVGDGATARLTWPLPLTVRAGARYIGARFVVEIDAELAHHAAAAPVFALTGVAARPFGGAARTIAAVPLGPRLEDRFAVRGAVDVVVVPGVLTLSAGYAFAASPVTRATSTPDLPAGAAHIIALGVEGRVAGAVVTLGVARTFLGDVVLAADASAVPVAGALGGLDIPAAGGRTGGAATQVSLTADIDL